MRIGGLFQEYTKAPLTEETDDILVQNQEPKRKVRCGKVGLDSDFQAVRFCEKTKSVLLA